MSTQSLITTIIHDIDGVHLDWVKGWMDWMRESKGIRSTHESDGVDCYRFSSTYPDLSFERITKLIEEFNSSEHFETLPPVLGSVEALAALRSEFPHIKHIAFTACGSHPLTIARRALQTAAIGFDDARIIPLDADKSFIFRQFGPSAIVIEDSPGNLGKALAAGCHPIAMHWEYNRDAEVLRGRGWSEVLQHVRRLIESTALAA